MKKILMAEDEENIGAPDKPCGGCAMLFSLLFSFHRFLHVS